MPIEVPNKFCMEAWDEFKDAPPENLVGLWINKSQFEIICGKGLILPTRVPKKFFKKVEMTFRDRVNVLFRR